MCIGNTTSPAANNTTNVRYGAWGDPDDWERPEVITPTGDENKKNYLNPVKNKLKTPSKSQSNRTSGGTY